MSLYIIEDRYGALRDSSVNYNYAKSLQQRKYPDGHIVEMVPAKPKVQVSQEEAEMLEQAKCDDDPAELIVGFVNSRDNYDDDSKSEDRLMRAYVIGWTVKKEPKRWNVKVPHTKFYYWKWKPNEPGVGSGEDDDVRGVEPYRFTLAEIEHYDLQDCEKREVKE